MERPRVMERGIRVVIQHTTLVFCIKNMGVSREVIKSISSSSITESKDRRT